ncbi:MAG: hypothetical protein M1827_001163 [Pycnora praestabilis]|nr:MAG: hypothetical protein M1827_001163 [Pycnora praestabilis]
MKFIDTIKNKLGRKDCDLSRTTSFKSSRTSMSTPSTTPEVVSSNNAANQTNHSHFRNGNSGSSAPTRRPDRPGMSAFTTPSNAPPPAYSPPENNTLIPGLINTTADDPYAFLSSFDTIFLIDDSGSMAGRSWRETSAALRTVTPICTAHDADGVDLYFLNHPDNVEYKNITTTIAVEQIFSTVRPMGGTPTGIRLNNILKPYLREYESKPDTTKPLNIIVITDGVPSDDVESVIINAAKKLDKFDAPAWQVGIQFFQVGNEQGAAAALQELDDGLAEVGGGVRDIVDTVPWTSANGEGLNGEGILKVVLGAVNRRLDRKSRASLERQR